jgi:hypothetical protein
MRECDDLDAAVREQVPQEWRVVVLGLGVQQVASGHVCESLAKGDQSVETADGGRDDLEALRVLVHLAGQHLEREVVAAEHHHRLAIAGIRRDEDVDSKRAGRRPVELLCVIARGALASRLDEADGFEALEVMTYPCRMAVEFSTESRKRRRTAHQPAKNGKPMLVGQRTELVVPLDRPERFHGGDP